MLTQGMLSTAGTNQCDHRVKRYHNLSISIAYECDVSVNTVFNNPSPCKREVSTSCCSSGGVYNSPDYSNRFISLPTNQERSVLNFAKEEG